MRRALILVPLLSGCAWALDFDKFTVAEAEGGVADADAAAPDAPIDAGPDAAEPLADAARPDGGPDGSFDGGCPRPDYAEGPAAESGTACNLAAVATVDDDGVGLARTGTSDVPMLDGIAYTACVEARFAAPVSMVIVRLRAVPAACGASCAGCEPRDAVVFADGRHIADLTATDAFVSHYVEAAASTFLVCRGGAGADRGDLEIDWIGHPGC